MPRLVRTLFVFNAALSFMACGAGLAVGDDPFGNLGVEEGAANLEDTGGNAQAPEPVWDNLGSEASVYCAGVSNWDGLWLQLENEVLSLTNEARLAGANCHSRGVFEPTSTVQANDALRCAARKHSQDMATREFFDHTNPDGELPWARTEAAGYDGGTQGENIAAGQPTAASVVQAWLDSDGHCANMMSPSFSELGVGYYGGGSYGSYWTQNFGG